MALRCVVVEDQVMFLQLLVAMLRTQPNLEVVATAQGVEEAIAVCAEHHPHLLILDLALPDGDGLAVVRALKDQPEHPAVIVLSGQASSFVCPCELAPLVQAVVDKTRAYADLNTEIKRLLQAPGDREEPAAKAAALSSFSLTVRERQVFRLIGKGHTNRAIAELLGLSLRTVETHRKHIAAKMGAKGGDLVRLAALELQMALGGAQ
jgi:DNA-binding NarL/FixJ family response regulator